METNELVLFLIILIISLCFTSYISAKESYLDKAAAWAVIEVGNTLQKERVAPSAQEDEPFYDAQENKEEKGEAAPAIQQAPAEKNKEYIEIKNFKFMPSELTITPGTTVIWTNNDWTGFYGRPHMVASHYNLFRSSRLVYGESFNFTFTEPGSYGYVDALYKSSNSGSVSGKAVINVEELSGLF